MQAVILAGGLGTRLRPVVDALPKSMAPMNGRPFLEFQIENLRSRGYTKILLLVGYRAESIVDHFGDGSAFGVNIAYSIEEGQLGTAGALKNAEAQLAESFLLLNGDTFLDLEYNELAERHRKRGSLLTMALVEVADAGRYGAVEMAGGERIVRFGEKCVEGPGYINAGVYAMEKGIVRGLPSGRTISLEGETIPHLIAADEPVFGFVTRGYFIDIGTPESYQAAGCYFAGRKHVYKK